MLHIHVLSAARAQQCCRPMARSPAGAPYLHGIAVRLADSTLLSSESGVDWCRHSGLSVSCKCLLHQPRPADWTRALQHEARCIGMAARCGVVVLGKTLHVDVPKNGNVTQYQPQLPWNVSRLWAVNSRDRDMPRTNVQRLTCGKICDSNRQD